jgi:predicted Zn finger-like uncharacterized protein
MDVRCEKCQTEYELDESRLKPGGVTVKCTNCGHMFKIRKRANTNVGVAASGQVTNPVVSVPAQTQATVADRPRPMSKPPGPPPGANTSGAIPATANDTPSGPMNAGSGAERQWLVRMENGEQKQCKELATLQQWIVAGVVTRESLISRTGKTWKRLGDISELTQYFVIADEARSARSVKSTGKPAAQNAGTMLGLGTAAPKPGAPANDDEDGRATGNFRARPSTPPPPPPAAAAAKPEAREQKPSQGSALPPRAAPTQGGAESRSLKPPDDGRQTAAWAHGAVKASESMAAMPQGPRAGKLSTSPDDKAFGGRVRLQPSDDAAFESGRVLADDDDAAELYPQRRGSKAGMWIALISLLVIGAAAGAVYMLVFNKKAEQPIAQPAGDAATVATATLDGGTAVVVTPLDAAGEVAADPLASARAELLAGVNARIKTALDGLAGKDDPASLAIRSRLSTALAQSMQDRALFVDKAEADKLRKSVKQIVLDAVPLAQRAFSGQQDSASANLAMADVLRLQDKAAPAVKRYIDTARTKVAGDKELAASVALSDGLLALRDGKLADASKALSGVDAPDDMRIKIAQAQILYAQSKPADAKALVDQVLATQPDHDVALAMYKKLETTVASSDPLPPEEPTHTTAKNPTNPNPNPPAGGGDSYDALLAHANKLAETNCTKAMELFHKALDQKPNGVEALTGMGYCHLDAKQFSSAFSKFRAALAVSARYEPALGGVAETYQRQGNKDAAIEAWRRYLEVYPSSPKAKKQLEILGAPAEGSAPAPQPQPQPQPEQPPPAPAPTPAAEPPAAGPVTNP